MTRRATQRSAWLARSRGLLALGLAAAGGLSLLAAFGFTVGWVEHTLSPDGWVSSVTANRIALMQAAMLLVGAVCVVAAGLLVRRAWVVAAAVGLSLCAALAFVHAFYPRNLLFNPRRLVGAVLGTEMLLRNFAPEPTLRVPTHEVLQSRYPTINIHAHFSYPGLDTVKSPEEIVAIMDACNVAQAVNLDGPSQGELDRYAGKAPERLITFAEVWFDEKFPAPGQLQKMVEGLDAAKRTGAAGIKIWKNLGLHSQDKEGHIIPLDDPRVELLWQKADALKLPILIHLGDPEPFFHPVDATNERYEELVTFGGLGIVASLADPSYPRPAQLLARFERVVERFPGVTFIGAHMLMLGHDLDTLGAVLDRHPNLSVDISAMGHELGRQPVTARKFFVKYADRILFGTDGNPDEGTYRQYFRFLQTADEYFDYPGWPKYKPGRWKIYGLDLPDEVLQKIYHDNAAKVLGLPLLSERKS